MLIVVAVQLYRIESDIHSCFDALPPAQVSKVNHYPPQVHVYDLTFFFNFIGKQSRKSKTKKNITFYNFKKQTRDTSSSSSFKK